LIFHGFFAMNIEQLEQNTERRGTSSETSLTPRKPVSLKSDSQRTNSQAHGQQQTPSSSLFQSRRDSQQRDRPESQDRRQDRQVKQFRAFRHPAHIKKNIELQCAVRILPSLEKSCGKSNLLSQLLQCQNSQ
jgi:hypothetical protein